MRRRVVLQWGTAILAAPQAVLARTQRRFRVGILWATDEPASQAPGAAFLAGLGDFGYVPGKNLLVDVRFARVGWAPVRGGGDEIQDDDHPIVLLAAPDPVAAGLVRSIARPGTNVTGNAFRQDELVAKQIELLTEIVPGMSRIGLLNYAPSPEEPLVGVVARYDEFARAAAAAKGLRIAIVAARDPAGVRKAFAALEQARTQGVVVAPTGPTYQLRHEIIDSARRMRLPSISALPPEWVEAGGLLNYGPDFLKHYRYAASFVDRILKGASPAEIPIEYPALFQLAVNLKTAQEIGVTVPRSIMARADRVVE